MRRGRGGARLDRMRVVGEAVDPRRLEATAAAGPDRLVAVIDAAEGADEGQRMQRAVALQRVGAARRQRPGDDLRARVGVVDRRIGGAHERPVGVRRDRGAPATGDRALQLGLQPQRLVGLVPDQVAVGDAAVAARHRLGELPELPRVGLIARVAQRRHAAGPERSGAGDGEQRGHAVGDDERDGLVGRGPVVLRVVGVARVEAQRLGRRRARPGRSRPSGPGCGRCRSRRRPSGRRSRAPARASAAGCRRRRCRSAAAARRAAGAANGEREERRREGEGGAKPRPEGSFRLRVSAQGAEPAAGWCFRPRVHAATWLRRTARRPWPS